MLLRALLSLSLLVPISAAHAQDADAKRQLGMAGQALGKALASHDQAALEKLWSPQMIVNGPNNNVLTRAEIFEGMKNGQLDYETGYKTTIEKIEFFGNVAVTMGEDSYEAERRPVAAEVLAHSNARLKQAIERKDIPTQRNASTMQLGISYRGSALAWDDRNETAPFRAGDRAPDATKLTTAKGERRLFDLTRGGRFTVLAFGDKIALEAPPFALRIRHVVGQPAGPDEIADSEGHLAKAYGATDRTLVLIRPDGYIALISDVGDVLAVLDYLAAIEWPIAALRS